MSTQANRHLPLAKREQIAEATYLRRAAPCVCLSVCVRVRVHVRGKPAHARACVHVRPVATHMFSGN